jgi:hypothetical protein
MTEMSRLRSASLDMTGLRLYCPPTYLLNSAPLSYKLTGINFIKFAEGE